MRLYLIALKKVLLGICIELYRLVYLNIPNLEQRIFEQTNMRFIEIKIPGTNSDTRFSEIEIAYFFNPHAWKAPANAVSDSRTNEPETDSFH